MAGAEVNATLMLCDYADSVGGKLYIVGGGWNQLHTRTPPSMGLAIELEIADELAARRLAIVARLVTLKGDPVADSATPVAFEAEMEFGRRRGTDVELPLGGVFAVSAIVRGVQFEPGAHE